MPKTGQIIGEILEFVKEIEVYEGYKELMGANVRKVETAYQRGSYGYLEFQTRLKTTLKDKSRQEWDSYYSAYIYSLLKKADYLLSELYITVQAGKKEKGEAKEAAAVLEEKKPELREKIGELKSMLSAPSERAKVPEASARPEFTEAVERITSRLKKQAAIESAPQIEEEISVEAPEAGEADTGIKLAGEKAGQRLAAEQVEVKEKKHFSFAVLAKKLAFIAAPAKGLAWGFRMMVAAAKRKPPAAKQAKPALTLAQKPSARTVEFSAFGSFVKKSFGTLFSTVKNEARKEQKLPVIDSLISRMKTAAPHKKKQLFVEEIVEMEKTAKKKEAPVRGGGVVFGGFFGMRFIQDVLKRFREKQEPIVGEKTAIPLHVKKLREMRAKLYEAEHLGSFEATLLAQEAKRVKTLIEAERPEVYKGSSIGLVANVTVKKISLSLVNTFPEFFGFLYNALRAANVKILSNTYVNIMILCTVSMFFGVSFFLSIVFFILRYPLYHVLIRSVVFGLVSAGLCATIFYVYPFMKIKERRRNTMTNMPFAINHLSSVSASGVPPARMFELIAQSTEYGDVAIEIKKIVDFMDVFGYDLLTALRSVSATTPSIPFKEFLEGMVSTIETGGDLDSYLKQKAEESTTTYQLERQRYNESISTYSDIYTGLLIAAPLFFIAALALINMLGGTLGGMGVETVMALAAYLAIPLLNVIFLVFLQVSQPEV